MLVYRSIIIIIAVIILIIACDDSPTRYGKAPVDMQFPDKTGMLWKYEVYDSLTQITDTVWVSFTDDNTNSEGEIFIEWKEKHASNNLFLIKHVRSKGDTIEIHNFNGPWDTHIERLIYPLELGESWAGLEANDDTSTVTLVGQISVPAETFNNGARIDRSWGKDFEDGGNWSQTWIVPDVGIVSRYFLSQFSDGSSITVTKNETWQLIDYDFTTFEITQFPNKVGNEWIYEQKDSVYYHHDSIIISYDTVTATIIDEGHFNDGDPYTVWEFAGSLMTDTMFLVTYENHLTFMYDTMHFSFMDVSYDFPLAVGKTWGIDYFVPVPEVLDKELIHTPAGIFESSFHTHAIGGAFNDYWTQDDWLVPDVGIVKSKRWQFGFIPSMDRTRTLIEYNLVE